MPKINRDWFANEEQKHKMSEAQKGRKASKETKLKLKKIQEERSAKNINRNAAICADTRKIREIAKDYNLSDARISQIKKGLVGQKETS